MDLAPNSIDEARLRPHLRARTRLEPSPERRRMHVEQSEALRQALAAGDTTPPWSRATAAGDRRKLRGIPVQARGVGSVIAGTQPEQQATRGQDETPSEIATFILHANARRRAA